MEKVLVSGVSGFIGMHCAKQLLDKGYKVVGTTRSASKHDEVMAAIGHENLSLVNADLLSDENWDSAIEGCDYVLHVASPVMMGEPDHEDVLVKPAKEGTMRVVQLAAKHKVKRVVITSSVAAVSYGPHHHKDHFDDTDWSDINDPGIPSYNKSKTVAEKAAREFVAGLSGEDKLEICTMHPALVVGPSLSSDIGESNTVVKRMLDGSTPGTPKLHMGFVDVRDVAAMHVAAMTAEGAAGQRFILSESSLWLSEMSTILRDAGFDKAPKRNIPNFILKIIALRDKDLSGTIPLLGRVGTYDISKTKDILGWQPTKAADAIVDTAEHLKAKGLI